MSNVKWTEDQQRAIDLRYKKILVSAAAGSGKTAVLVERIIKIITDDLNPVDIDKLLIVTFTNAAAAEMRERIGEAINKKIKENPNSRNLQKQLILLNKASISTLHSFCLNLIKNNFHQLDIEPNFRVGDTTEINLLKMESLEELLEEKYVEGRKEFLDLVESYCDNKSDKALGDIILHLYNFSMSMAEPREWLIKSAEKFNVGEDFSFEKLPFKDALLEELKSSVLEALTLNNEGMDLIINNEFLSKYIKTFESDGEILERTLMYIDDELNESREFLEGTTFARIPTITKLNDEEKTVQENAKACRDKVKELWNDVRLKALNATSSEVPKICNRLYPMMKELASLVLEFREKFQSKKRERGIIDFNDQEHFALDILKDTEDRSKPSNAALELRNKYEEILVDEYQDSNNVQEEIVSLICREEKDERNVFMVGDLKQSIYRFRMAKPELFKEKKDTYPKDGDEYNALITLHKNFRSREEVIDGINYIFKCVMSEEVGELTYDEEEELKVGASFKESDENLNIGGAVEVNLIDLDDNLEQEEVKDQSSVEENDESKTSEEEIEKEELDAIQLEARFVASRIISLMESDGDDSLKVYDKALDEYRNVTYKDIVILLRSSNKLSPIFIDEFKKVGIPLFSEGGGGYFEALEIKTILSALEIIDNPLQDIPLIATLRSPIGGFTTEDLADIRIAHKKCSFYEAMVKILKGEKPEKIDEVIKEIFNNEELKNKINTFISKIDNWRMESRYTPINKLIWEIVTTTGYYGYVGALPGGKQRQANLKILFKRAKEFEKTSYRGLYSFINFIHNIKQSNEDMGSAKIIGENENVVRIMSIHKSKGLEFPVVFLCGLSKKFNESDLKGKILFHQELGFGPTYIDLDNRISFNTPQREFIGKKIKSENISEEMRLLYVALTRAKEKLILVGSSKNIDKRITKWSEAKINDTGSIDISFVKRQSNYMDWIGASIINHRDGEKLRHYVENIFKETMDDKSKFKVNIYPKDKFSSDIIEVKEETTVAEKLSRLLKSYDNEEKNKYVSQQLNYKYKFYDSTKMPTVTTVTELKEASNLQNSNKTQDSLDEDNYINRDLLDEVENQRQYKTLMQTPVFLQEKKGLTPSEVGTAYHSIMERLNLSEEITLENIRKQVNDMVNFEFITYEAANAVNLDKIFNFFNSELGSKVLEAHKLENLKRELPFRIEIDASKVYPNLEADIYREDKMLLRGVIDCYIDMGEDGIIIDYKTDHIPDGNVDKIKERYKVQLDYYSEAVKKVFKKKKIKRYLYLFSIGEFLEVE